MGAPRKRREGVAPKRRKRAGWRPSGRTLDSTNTGIPASEWFKPSTSTADNEIDTIREEVESYIQHIERDLTPLVSVRELLGRVLDQICAHRLLADDHEELTEQHEILKERCTRTRIERVLKQAIKDHESDIWAIADEVVNLLDKGIEPADEDATPTTQVTP